MYDIQDVNGYAGDRNCPDLKNLKILNLSFIKLNGSFLIEVIAKIPGLRELLLDNNHFVHIFENFAIKSAITNLASLERLSLNNMTLDADCLNHGRFKILMFLNLQCRDKKESLLKLFGLPRTNAEQLTVDFTGRSLKSVEVESSFSEDFENKNAADIWITNKGYNLIVKMDYVNCVCNNDVLWRALHDFSRFMAMPGLKCDSNDGRDFVNEPLDTLNCLKASVHGCRRRISRDFNYITIADCSYNTEKFRWPRPDKNYISLNASGNAYPPPTLQVNNKDF